MNVVESEVVDVWIDRTLWLLIGMAIGLWLNDKPISEMAIMKERLNHRYLIEQLESLSRERAFNLHQTATAHDKPN